MTVKELLARIDSLELAEWRAEYLIRAEEQERESMRQRAQSNATNAMNRKR